MVEELPVSNGEQPGLKLASAAPSVELLICDQECLLRQVISRAAIAPNQAPQKGESWLSRMALPFSFRPFEIS